MKLSQMQTLVNLYVDDVPNIDEIILLLNAGKDRMAVEVKCKFPDIVKTTDLNETFVFDSEYHEIPVYYAAAMIKSQDSALNEKDNYMGQFLSGLQNFTENYDPPVQYLNLSNVQHFTATEGQTDFTITKNGYNYLYGNLKVYRNSVEEKNWSKDGNNFFLSVLTPAAAGQVITAVWEVNSDYIYPPAYYPGWG